SPGTWKTTAREWRTRVFAAIRSQALSSCRLDSAKDSYAIPPARARVNAPPCDPAIWQADLCLHTTLSWRPAPWRGKEQTLHMRETNLYPSKLNIADFRAGESIRQCAAAC